MTFGKYPQLALGDVGRKTTESHLGEMLALLTEITLKLASTLPRHPKIRAWKSHQNITNVPYKRHLSCPSITLIASGDYLLATQTYHILLPDRLPSLPQVLALERQTPAGIPIPGFYLDFETHLLFLFLCLPLFLLRDCRRRHHNGIVRLCSFVEVC